LLNELINKTFYILREVKVGFKNPCVLWSTGKDSTTLLHLIKTCFNKIIWPVIHIDTGFKFREIIDFRDKLKWRWHIPLIIARFDCDKFPSQDRFECCLNRKTYALRQIIEACRFDAVLVSIRRDEHAVRGKERVFSPRNRDFQWLPYNQQLELNGWAIYQTEFGNQHHVRVHPLLHWCEIDIWNYILKYRLPINPLYFSKDGFRYRSLGCKPCTMPVKSDAKSVKEIVEELKVTDVKERDGRVQDKEKVFMMERLRALGYL